MNPIVLVIFGGSGDLTFRKLLPAMYNIFALNSLGRPVDIIPIGRRDLGIEGYRDQAENWIKENTRLSFQPDLYEKFRRHIHYFRMDLNKQEGYDRLKTYLEDSFAGSERIFYYAVSPEAFHPITDNVRASGLNAPGTRIILEKPFGDNLADAGRLNEELNETYGEGRIYHIDHYLGKEMIINILSVRFQNAIFSGIWNHRFIDNVQINAFETVGVETRGGYYDQNGAFRDMVQNHLFQVLSVLAIERPADKSPEALHEAQLAVLKALRPVEGEDALGHLVLGQYDGYRAEPRVDPESRTATFASLKVYIDNERWKDVPFYIRTGKKMHKRDTEIIVTFRQTEPGVEPNLLIIKVQPDEGIYLRFNVKKPGTENVLTDVHMDYCQSCNLENYQNTPEAYERLLQACIESDHSMFSHWDQIQVSWEFANRLLDSYLENGGPIYTYGTGSHGPEASEEMLARDGRAWIYDAVGSEFTSRNGNGNGPY